MKYRTKQIDEWVGTDKWTTEYAVIPTIWLSDFTKWLSDIGADIVETTDNVDDGAIIPTDWPSYETCRYCMAVSDTLHCVL
jgi:hypothetical protein